MARLALFVRLIVIFSAFKLTQGINDVCMVVESYGYGCQDHQVTTLDGYGLGLQRINGQNPILDTPAPAKQPILLQHGILVDGMTWVLSPQGLALSLADAGFDVWIANSRGTRFSRGHTRLNADIDQDYWSWTWDQMANYDLTATFVYVHSLTGQKVHYVGHSLGTLTMLASLSQHRLVDNVKAVALLAPVAHLDHITTLFVRLAADLLGDQLIDLLGGAEFKPQGQILGVLFNTLCSLPGIDCGSLVAALTGPNCCINTPVMDMFLKYEPQSTSTRNIVHLAQMVRDGRVDMYNYDNIFTNFMNYGRSNPPAYDLSRIPTNIPLFLIYGGMDALSDVEDVAILIGDLKNHQSDKLTVKYIAEYAHADFLMANNVEERINAPLIAFFRSNAH